MRSGPLASHLTHPHRLSSSYCNITRSTHYYSLQVHPTSPIEALSRLPPLSTFRWWSRSRSRQASARAARGRAANEEGRQGRSTRGARCSRDPGMDRWACLDGSKGCERGRREARRVGFGCCGRGCAELGTSNVSQQRCKSHAESSGPRRPFPPDFSCPDEKSRLCNKHRHPCSISTSMPCNPPSSSST